MRVDFLLRSMLFLVMFVHIPVLSAFKLLFVLLPAMVQPVLFMNEFLAAQVALDNGMVMYVPCMSNQLFIISKLFTALVAYVLLVV